MYNETTFRYVDAKSEEKLHNHLWILKYTIFRENSRKLKNMSLKFTFLYIYGTGGNTAGKCNNENIHGLFATVKCTIIENTVMPLPCTNYKPEAFAKMACIK